MLDSAAFAAQIRAHYPEGLTGVIPVGGTRTTYILDQNRGSANPGHIQDFFGHADYLLKRYFGLIDMFFDLGGQNIIIPVLAYDRFTTFGTEYAELISKTTLSMIDEKAQQYYQQNEIDPYFIGIDTLHNLPADHPGHQLGEALSSFNRNWHYQEGRRKVLWEIAGMPLFSFWNTSNIVASEVQAELKRELEATNDLEKIRQLTYRYYSRAMYGTDLPMPHFYLGSNRNGDLKLGSALSTSLTWAFMCRLYFVPYPTLFLTQQTLQTILDDLTFGKRLRSQTTDYKDQYTQELVEAEYQRVMALSADPNTTIGLTRRIQGYNVDED